MEKNEWISTEEIMNADVYKNRIISMEKVDKGLSKIYHRRVNLIDRIGEKIGQSYEKIVLYVVKDVMLKEMKKPYYDNAAHVLKFIDIDSHMVLNEDGTMYRHVENLCIWQNGFYEFNSFNMTTLAMRYSKANNFNEEIAQELQELDSHGKLVSIDSEDKGTNEDYAKLEAKILKMSKQSESYTE